MRHKVDLWKKVCKSEEKVSDVAFMRSEKSEDKSKDEFKFVEIYFVILWYYICKNVYIIWLLSTFDKRIWYINTKYKYIYVQSS